MKTSYHPHYIHSQSLNKPHNIFIKRISAYPSPSLVSSSFYIYASVTQTESFLSIFSSFSLYDVMSLCVFMWCAFSASMMFVKLKCTPACSNSHSISSIRVTYSTNFGWMVTICSQVVNKLVNCLNVVRVVVVLVSCVGAKPLRNVGNFVDNLPSL